MVSLYLEFMHACSFEELEVAENIFEKGNLDVDYITFLGDSLSTYACREGYFNIVRFLVEKGATINCGYCVGTIPLHLSIDNPDIVKFLLDNGAEVDYKNNNHTTALIEASVKGYLETVKILIKYGAYIDHQEVQGWTPLICASENDHNLETTKFLVEHGASVDKCNCSGDSAIIIASINRCIKTVFFFIEQGVDINHTDKHGHTFICYLGKVEREKTEDHINYISSLSVKPVKR